MNAFTRTAMNALPRVTPIARRNMATESRAHLHYGMPKNFNELRNSIWLSDAGAYPVIFVLTFATGMCASYITYCATRNPDVRISPGRRQQLIRDWD
mmetsp:Transcript_13567/g.28646  ORF Transcript_13567/g.28646 Transcript_13567/m.28646 type:complete len:97 (-) Transcript_13567:217-507(-)|eukprot:CAMPEP_0171332262 /NCGR_PEP_ID=MMETSP0878-20121228/3238_1 /TAXON_ID=67004 /ORGANISM="Thalassiosira weissflogii, Strain CCMP1336" /LENGTH=96 /DNA_ID=CAMNT_0011832961 /DNA_START=67 /DNA_END=357 /DNA_ORIENTATION=-